MTCERWRELLSRFVFGDLRAAQRRRMQRHLETCPACARDLELYRNTVEVARQLPDAEVPPELAKRLIEAVEAEIRARAESPGPAAGAPAPPPGSA